MQLVLRLPYLTPSANDWVNKRSAFWKYRQIRASWEAWVFAAWAEERSKAGRVVLWLQPPGAKVHVTIERLSPTGGLDIDNFIGGLKPVIDALKVLRFIDDDAPSALELTTRQRPGEKATIITLTREDP